MPCVRADPTPEELSRDNNAKYGLYCTYPQMMRGIACEALSLLEASGLLAQTSEHAQRWFAEHKAIDAKQVPSWQVPPDIGPDWLSSALKRVRVKEM